MEAPPGVAGVKRKHTHGRDGGGDDDDGKKSREDGALVFV